MPRALNGDLRYVVHENAVIVPSASDTLYRNIHGGAFDADLRPIEASLLTRTWNPPQISFAPDIGGLDPETVETVDAPHIYGGYFFNQFGHFLLESLARAWVVEDVGVQPFAWASGGPVRPWQAEILSLLGLDAPMRFPRGPIRFRQLIVPEPGFRIQGIFHPRHARFLGRVSIPRNAQEGRIWLSRTALGPGSRCPGEISLQRRLEEAGWRIIHPERLSVTEQLRLLAQADLVAGLEGSAFHAAVLLREPSAPFLMLRRTRSRNYRAIADRKGITEFDLYGAFRIHARSDRRLFRPRDAACTIDGLARQFDACRDDSAACARLRIAAEAEHSFQDWNRRQRRHMISRARAFVAEQKIGKRLRWKLMRVFGS